jgi:hypothetical protein
MNVQLPETSYIVSADLGLTEEDSNPTLSEILNTNADALLELMTQEPNENLERCQRLTLFNCLGNSDCRWDGVQKKCQPRRNALESASLFATKHSFWYPLFRDMPEPKKE